MVESITPNERRIRDSLAKRRGALDPSEIVFNAQQAALKTSFPNTDITLEDLIGQKATESLVQNKVAERVAIANNIHRATKETALYMMVDKLAPSAILQQLGYIRHDALVPALHALREDDARLSSISDAALEKMAVDVQTAIEKSVNAALAERTAPTHAARLGGDRGGKGRA